MVKGIELLHARFPESLAKYVARVGQTETARRARVSQGAIWQMLKADREIYVIESYERATLVEIKVISQTEDVGSGSP